MQLAHINKTDSTCGENPFPFYNQKVELFKVMKGGKKLAATIFNMFLHRQRLAFPGPSEDHAGNHHTHLFCAIFDVLHGREIPPRLHLARALPLRHGLLHLPHVKCGIRLFHLRWSGYGLHAKCAVEDGFSFAVCVTSKSIQYMFAVRVISLPLAHEKKHEKVLDIF